MSLEKIIDQIDAEAKQKANEILTGAKKEAQEIKKRSVDKAKNMRASILQQAEAEAKEREKRMLQMAGLQGRKAILAEKQKAINQIFNAAVSRLAGLNPGKYKSVIRHMLFKAVRSGREEIIFSPKDKKIIDAEWLKGINKEMAKEKGITGALRISHESRAIKGGFALREGEIEVNSTFEAILKSNQSGLESEIAEILFGKSK